jgi:zinc transport system substrate-binding protein
MKSTLIALIICANLLSCSTKKTETGTVVATTSWTAAYAMAAGATDVTVLAPYEMVHPSEYELRPGDIVRLNNSKLIVYAGYEVIVSQFKTGLDLADDKMVKIATSYNYEEISNSVMMIAEKIGTEEIALKNLQEIKDLLLKGKEEVQKSGFDKHVVLVHFFQESFAKEMGITPSLVFGPAPPEPKQILQMAQTNSTLILDNAHSPVGGPIKEILKNGEYRLLLNFPGLYNTRTIADVIRYNTLQITAGK